MFYVSVFFAGLGVLGLKRVLGFGRVFWGGGSFCVWLRGIWFSLGCILWGFFVYLSDCDSRLLFLVSSWIFFSLFFATSLHRWFSFSFVFSLHFFVTYSHAVFINGSIGHCHMILLFTPLSSRISI